jgi:hypothetical protein
MSDQQPAKPPGPTSGRNPWVTALLILIGIILLLPGLCSVFVSVIWIRSIVFDGYHPGAYDSGVLSILLPCLAVGAAGVVLIVIAVRR